MGSVDRDAAQGDIAALGNHRAKGLACASSRATITIVIAQPNTATIPEGETDRISVAK